MQRQDNKQLLTYWNSVRAGRQAPKRTEITPAAISPMLPTTFILELRGKDDLGFRIAGSRLCEIFGREFRGENFLKLWPSPERPIIRRHLGQLMSEGTIVTFNCEAVSENGHTGKFELLLLPLTHSGTAIDRILGSITPSGDYPWLGLVPLQFRAINEVHVCYLRAQGEEAELKTGQRRSLLRHKRLVKAKNCQLRVFDGGKV